MKSILTFLCLIATLSSFAQTGIGTTTPNASAKLDVTSTTQGFLPPRVVLTATNVFAPITGTAASASGLLVFNTNTAGNVTPGYYYWNGSAWLRLINPTDNATNVTGTVAVANGGTGSSTQNFVDLTTAQTVAGAKTFSGNTAVSGSSTFTVGTGATALGGSLAVTGTSTLTGNSTVGGTLAVTGATTLASAAVTNNASVGGNLTVTGNVTATSFIGNATSASFAPITYFTTIIPGEININQNFRDLVTFTLPVPGVYKITYVIRSYISTNETNGIIFLALPNNTPISGSELMPHYKSGAEAQGYGTMFHILTTTTANETYKLRTWAGGGGVMNIQSDPNGQSKFLWEKIQ